MFYLWFVDNMAIGKVKAFSYTAEFAYYIPMPKFEFYLNWKLA